MRWLLFPWVMSPSRKIKENKISSAFNYWSDDTICCPLIMLVSPFKHTPAHKWYSGSTLPRLFTECRLLSDCCTVRRKLYHLFHAAVVKLSVSMATSHCWPISTQVEHYYFSEALSLFSYWLNCEKPLLWFTDRKQDRKSPGCPYCS